MLLCVAVYAIKGIDEYSEFITFCFSYSAKILYQHFKIAKTPQKDYTHKTNYQNIKPRGRMKQILTPNTCRSICSGHEQQIPLGTVPGSLHMSSLHKYP